MYRNVRTATYFKKLNILALALLFAPVTYAQSTTNQQMVFEGTLSDSSGSYLNLSGQTLYFYISANGCYLYGESSTTAGDSQGNILHRFGSGSILPGSPNSYSQSLFYGSANGTTTFSGSNCSVSASDTRVAQVQYGSISASMNLGSVPYAQNASYLNGKTAADFVPNSTDTNTLLYGGTIGQYLVKGASGLEWSSSSVTAAQITTALGYAPVSSTANHTFTTGSSGVSFNISSSGDTHTFNIPYAATSGVIGGLLSNADYLIFANKINATSSAVISALGYTPANNANLGSLAAKSSVDLSSADVSGTLSVVRLPNFTGDVSSTAGNNSITVTKIRGQNISVSAPTTGQILSYDGSNWGPVTIPMGGGTVTNVSSTNPDIIVLSGTTTPTLTLNVGTGANQIPRLDVSGTLSTALLQDSGVTAGTYYKVSVDNKGRVTSGAQLSSSDVTNALGYAPISSTSGTLQTANNLSDLTSSATARANLGLTSLATKSSIDLSSTDVSGTLSAAHLPSFTGDVTSTVSGSNNLQVVALRGSPIATTAPISGSVLKYDGSAWVPANITTSQWTTSGSIVYYSGKVGIGTATPVTKFEVSGGVRIGMESAACGVSYAGTLRYNAGSVEFCNGTTWSVFGVSGAGISSLNGATSPAQTFVAQISGSTFNISTSGSIHTFSIPMAWTASSTAGLLSNADYNYFSGKLDSTSSAVISALGYTPESTAGTLGVARLPSFTGDVYSLSGTNTISVVKIQGRNVSSMTPAASQVLSYNTLNQSWEPTTLAFGNGTVTNVSSANGDISITTPSTTPTLTLNAGTGASQILRLDATGTAPVTILPDSGVSVGTYTKVSVDLKGRVTSGAQLNSSDVTTALGYVPVASGTISTPWTVSGSVIHYVLGKVGIGISNPVSKLEVAGGVRIGMDSSTCLAWYAGTIRYNSGNVEFCNGISWIAVEVAGAGLQSLNGSTSSTQTFANAFSGTTPIFSTTNGVHTLNIPYASAASVTGGLISNAEYTTFMNKITSSSAAIAQVLGYIPASATVLGNYLTKSNNLSDLASSAAARTNLGLGSLAIADSIDLGSVSASGTLATARLPSFAGDVYSTTGTNTLTVTGIQGRGVAATNPTTEQVLKYNGSQWAPSNMTSSQWTNNGADIYFSNGKVGIGTSSPHSLALLHVNSDNSTAAILASSYSSSPQTNAGKFVAARKNGAGYPIQGDTMGAFLAIDGFNEFSHSGMIAVATENHTATNMGSDLQFYTVNNGSTTGTQKMKITQDGNVGIGTTSPNQPLTIVRSGSKAAINLQSYGVAPTIYGSAATGTLGSPTPVGADNFLLIISGDGYAGSGSWPTQAARISLKTAEPWNTSTNATYISFDTTPSNTSAPAVERMRIDQNGNVGIGTTSPSSPLHISSPTSMQFTLETPGTGGVLQAFRQNGLYIGKIGFDGGSQNFVIQNQKTSAITFESGPALTQVMRITSNTVEVSGVIKLRSVASTFPINCTTSEEGSQRYHPTHKTMEYCDGTYWQGVTGLTHCPDAGGVVFTLIGKPGTAGAFCIMKNNPGAAEYFTFVNAACSNIQNWKGARAALCDLPELTKTCRAYTDWGAAAETNIPGFGTGSINYWIPNYYDGSTAFVVDFVISSNTCSLNPNVYNHNTSSVGNYYRCCYH